MDEFGPNFDAPGVPKKPDIVLYDNKKMTAQIVDLAVTCEYQTSYDYSASSFGQSRARKIEKYQQLKRFLAAKGYSGSVGDIVYGSLGSVCRYNMKVYLGLLGLHKGPAKSLERDRSVRHINANH